MNKNDIVEVITAVVKEEAKDIYNDGLKGATREGGQALETIVGLFNNVVLYPIKKANITYKYKLEQFESDLKEKMKNVPIEKIVQPPLSIVGPTIESLKYTFDTENLREMYLNLLSSSMNLDKIDSVHPSYVDIIKQLSPLDAKILYKAYELKSHIKCARVSIEFGEQYITNGMPRIFAPDLLIENYDPFLISASIENLCRLGLLTRRYDLRLKGYDYSSIDRHEYILERFKICKEFHNDKELYIKRDDEALIINNFGDDFINACII